MDRPQHPQVVTADLLEGQPPGQHLPQDDPPAEHVTLLAVGDAFKDLERQLDKSIGMMSLADLRGHPGGAALVVGHDCGLVTRRPKVTNLKDETVFD